MCRHNNGLENEQHEQVIRSGGKVNKDGVVPRFLSFNGEGVGSDEVGHTTLPWQWRQPSIQSLILAMKNNGNWNDHSLRMAMGVVDSKWLWKNGGGTNHKFEESPLQCDNN